MYTVYDYRPQLQVLLLDNGIAPIIKELSEHNARPLLVGGAVRDLLLGLPIHDLDIEVHGIDLEALEKVLKKFGYVRHQGKSFGVLKLENSDIDWAIPRRDSSGRHPHVVLDPHLSFKDAFERRDVTINAMGIDLITHELIDPFNGLEDLKHGILRTPNTEKFIEDPLRFYRVMQFISRFGMTPDAELNALCRTMSLADVARERIEQEFEKLCLKSTQPSRGIRWLKDINRLQEILPELAATVITPQNPEWHPEGDVFEHSMQAFDASAEQEFESRTQKLTIMQAALCHDLGKAVATRWIDGRWRSPGHAEAGAPLARALLHRITTNKERIAIISKLVYYHMSTTQLVKQKAGLNAYKRLARNLAPLTNILELAKLTTADIQGRNPIGNKPFTGPVEVVTVFLERAAQAGVLTQPEAPILTGNDIRDLVEPGPIMGELLKYAYTQQLHKEIRDKEQLKKLIVKRLYKQ